MTNHTAIDPDGLGPNAFVLQPTNKDFTISLGTTFLSAPATVDPMPVLAWQRNGGNGTLYMTYTGKGGSTNQTDTDVYVRKSTDCGTNWSVEIAVHPSSTNSQFHPWIAVDNLSTNVAVIWYDTRGDPQNKKPHLYAAVSRAAYQSPTTNLTFRLTPVAVTEPTNSFNLKEYIGMTYFKGSIYPAFLRTAQDASGVWNWDANVARVPY